MVILGNDSSVMCKASMVVVMGLEAQVLKDSTIRNHAKENPKNTVAIQNILDDFLVEAICDIP